MNDKWNGNERREITKDHDTLIQMIQILDNHVKNFNTHSEAFKSHEIRDQANFDALRKDILSVQKIIWIATGIVITVQALPAILKLTHFLNQ